MVILAAKEILPDVGCSLPVIRRKSEVLPAPFLPTNAMRSLALTKKDISLSIGLEEYSK